MPARDETMLSYRLDDRVALVTGASQGIGRGIAYRLAAQGATLALNYHPAEGEGAISQTLAELEGFGSRILVLPADVSQVEAARSMVDSVVDQLSQIDILVNNAGITLWRRVFDIDEESWDQ